MNQVTFYRRVQNDGRSIFYREAGEKDAPTHRFRTQRTCAWRPLPLCTEFHAAKRRDSDEEMLAALHVDIPS